MESVNEERKQTIYIVEDDDNIRGLISYALESAGFGAEAFVDGETFWRALGEKAGAELPDLVLLDVMLPGEDGFSILAALRGDARTQGMPVIMLTAKGAEIDRIKGLDSGADDYIAKPFSVMEALSRVRAVLRRSARADGGAAPGGARGPASDDPEFALGAGDITLYPNKRSVFAAGEEVTLTYKEFELLQYMLLNKGIVMTRDKLLAELWGYDYEGESRTVDMHIKTLRKKLGGGRADDDDGGGAAAVIKTIRNVGYKVEDTK